jgi:hypothetical protein
MAKAPHMSKAEFSRALTLAQSDIPLELAEFMKQTKFDGFACHGFEPVCCTLFEMAQLIAYQTFTFGGTIDNEALNEIWAMRHRFMIVGEGSDDDVSAKSRIMTAVGMIDHACESVGAF